MTFPGKRHLIGAFILSSFLTACGGGGGGGGGDDRSTQPQPDPLTELPVFLQGFESKCSFVEGGNTVSLVDYRGTLANVTAVNCTNAALTNLEGIDQLTALDTLNAPKAYLTGVAELLALATHLKTLNLELNTRLDASFINTVGQLNALENLDLSGTRLTDISALANLLNLKTLDVSDNKLNDISVLSGLPALAQVDLSKNTYVDCSDVFPLRNALEAAGHSDPVVLPSQCASAVTLSDSSEALRVVDNSQLDPQIYRVVILGEYDFADLKMVHQGNDFSIVLESTNGTKTLTFTDWYVDDNHKASRVEMPDGEEYYISSFNRYVVTYVYLGEEDDTFTGTTNIEYIYGGAGNDTLNGDWGSDYLYGQEGNDILIGSNGHDHLSGGPGDDIVISDNCKFSEDKIFTCGTYASDSLDDYYYYNPGDGNDIWVSNYYYVYTATFGSGITPGDLSFSKDNSDLIITLSPTGSIRLFGFFGTSRTQNPDMTIQFHDGTSFTLGALFLTNGLYGTSGNDVLEGINSVNDQFYGMDGDDIIRGNSGADQLDGGAGNDIIIGGDDSDHIQCSPGDDLISGDSAVYSATTGTFSSVRNDQDIDHFYFELGDGNDTIHEYSGKDYGSILHFGNGILSTNVVLTRNGDDLIIRINANDSITFYRWFVGYYYQLASFVFTDIGTADAPTFVTDHLAP